MAMAMAAAATSSVAMAQKAIQAEHHSSYAASSSSALGVRRISVNACELRSHFIVSRIGASNSRRPFVIAATAGEISRYDVEAAPFFFFSFKIFFFLLYEVLGAL